MSAFSSHAGLMRCFRNIYVANSVKAVEAVKAFIKKYGV
jgi:hypothetical protein